MFRHMSHIEHSGFQRSDETHRDGTPTTGRFDDLGLMVVKRNPFLPTLGCSDGWETNVWWRSGG